MTRADLIAQLRRIATSVPDDFTIALAMSVAPKAADHIKELLRLLARKLCNCGLYLETDLSHHADYCVYRMEMEELEGGKHGE